tara:strand:- start:805 stop:1104 length:300 start_codon:yes stop_codon:yes gene_type:complete
MAFAFCRTSLAGRDAGFELAAQDIDILRGATHGQSRGGGADIGAIQAIADALRHVHVFGHAGIGAAGAEQRAQHGVPCGQDQFFGLVLYLRVGSDHFLK